MVWSAVVDEVEVVGASLALHRCTAWRRTTGFAERQVGGSLRRSPRAVQLLAGWLATQGADLRLQLVLHVGGKRRSSAWLGLSAVGVSPDAARRRLLPAAGDLGEALDAWQLFTEVPPAGPRHAQRALGAVADRLGSPGAPVRDQAPRLLELLAQLHRRPSCVALAFELRPTDTSPELIRAIAREQGRARHMEAPDELPWFLLGASSGLPHARQALAELWEQATAGAMRVRLYGSPPGSILRTGLEEALSDDLGLPLRLADGPPTTLVGWRRALHALLGAMAAGRELDEGEDGDDRADPDEIPF